VGDSGERFRDGKLLIGRGQGADAFAFAVGGDGTVLTFAGIAMDDETAAGDISDPIFDDAGSGV
jgi:hypothetical protein